MSEGARKPAEWMQLPIDDRILETLDRSGLVLTLAVIKYNIEKSREEVNRRLSVLTDASFVERKQRGHYEITERGEAYLSGEFDASDLREIGTEGD